MLKNTRNGLRYSFHVHHALFPRLRGLSPRQFKVLTEIQFIPALLALNVVVLVALLVLTLFGRVYCSSICPMGIFQDVVAWVSKNQEKEKIHFQ